MNSFIRKNFISIIKLGFSFLLSKKYPFVAAIRLNDQCNLKCDYCDSYKMNKVIPFQDLIAYLDSLHQKGCRMVILSGGEPFLYPHREELMDWLISKNFYISINTNGRSIENSSYRSFIDRADQLMLSLDGSKYSTDKHRGTGCYDAVIKTLDYIKPKKIKATISCVLTKVNTNKETYLHLAEIHKKYNASIEFNPVTERGRINNSEASLSLAPSKDQLIEFRDLFKSAPKLYPNDPTIILNYFINPKPITCKTIKYALYIDVTGDIFPCINVTDLDSAKYSSINEKYPTLNHKKKVTCDVCTCPTLTRANMLLGQSNMKLKLLRNSIERFFY
ncbi:radical SAM protein [Halobacteriovorax marinus]|uniref:radical SAM protein n=1 Tax=Halobacteriovorax marinus TaxID=97084 RepID=UPI003A904B29